MVAPLGVVAEFIMEVAAFPDLLDDSLVADEKQDRVIGAADINRPSVKVDVFEIKSMTKDAAIESSLSIGPQA